jgi:hypothetical protein
MNADKWTDELLEKWADGDKGYNGISLSKGAAIHLRELIRGELLRAYKDGHNDGVLEMARLVGDKLPEVK